MKLQSNYEPKHQYYEITIGEYQDATWNHKFKLLIIYFEIQHLQNLQNPNKNDNNDDNNNI